MDKLYNYKRKLIIILIISWFVSLPFWILPLAFSNSGPYGSGFETYYGLGLLALIIGLFISLKKNYGLLIVATGLVFIVGSILYEEVLYKDSSSNEDNYYSDCDGEILNYVNVSRNDFNSNPDAFMETGMLMKIKEKYGFSDGPYEYTYRFSTGSANYYVELAKSDKEIVPYYLYLDECLQSN